MIRAPGSPLYWRLFLTVAAAIVLFIALAIVTLALLVSRELEGYVHARQSPLGQQAADVFTRGGHDALRRWLTGGAAGIPGDVTVYVVAPDGTELLGRELPGWSARMMRAIAAHGPDPHPDNYRPTVLAPQLVGANGEVLSLFVMPRNVGPWGSSRTTLALLALALLVIAAAAWLVVRALTRPISELQLAVRGLASGRIEARVPTRIASRRDELGALATDFNAMADRLARLLEHREHLLRDVSHELRSPLTRLQAATVLAAHHGGLAPADRERIEREIRRMDALIGDILRYSWLGDATSMARRLVRIDELLRDIARDGELIAAGRGVALRLSAAPGQVVVGDPALLRSAFDNLVRNAIRHAPPGSEVEIAAVTGDAIGIEVRDRGEGVPAEYIERIFEPWFRVPRAAGADRDSSADDSGSTDGGLGLAIARRVFRLHGGDVAALPRDGGGLTLTVHLPPAQVS
ncbi:MAG TPA: HAMP domain-containing sensor histidine kinase [Steroidobacteraceae bacterium]|nr:HAMP domain-containing sensor histidine kinase [Steroidobacteraceae bacterium]HNS27835.1 HAMP domain-containing sensor histidine kinase [Steroidobacteraceae bacterium]